MNQQLAKDSQYCSNCPSTYDTDPAEAVAGSVTTCRHCAGNCLELYIRASLNWPTDLLQDGGPHLSQHASSTGPNRDPQYQVKCSATGFCTPRADACVLSEHFSYNGSSSGLQSSNFTIVSHITSHHCRLIAQNRISSQQVLLLACITRPVWRWAYGRNHGTHLGKGN